METVTLKLTAILCDGGRPGIRKEVIIYADKKGIFINDEEVEMKVLDFHLKFEKDADYMYYLVSDKVSKSEFTIAQIAAMLKPFVQ